MNILIIYKGAIVYTHRDRNSVAGVLQTYPDNTLLTKAGFALPTGATVGCVVNFINTGVLTAIKHTGGFDTYAAVVRPDGEVYSLFVSSNYINWRYKGNAKDIELFYESSFIYKNAIMTACLAMLDESSIDEDNPKDIAVMFRLAFEKLAKFIPICVDDFVFTTVDKITEKLKQADCNEPLPHTSSHFIIDDGAGGKILSYNVQPPKAKSETKDE